MGEPATHFIAAISDHGEESTCGLFYPDRMSGNWREVTCGACMRSRRYRAAQRGETMFYPNYRRWRL